ncbi:hypothetical protein FPV67DRAFT_1670111 [Lyophyllum atratum]|nr:hypothetical protein FPV67DRAFT_1670111 [Lyophyllum atratum]
MPHHGDFQLPGLANNPHALPALIVTMTFGYSRRGNRRRLEDHFHGFWNQVLTHLVFAEQYLFLAPQMSVYFEETPPSNPNLSIETQPGRAEELRPDFTIMGTRLRNATKQDSTSYRPEFPDDFRLWNNMVFESGTPRAFVELKRPPSRKINDAAAFAKALGDTLEFARVNAYDQAGIAFQRKDFAAADSIILIVAAGEWWQFRIITREEWEAAEAFNLENDRFQLNETAEEKVFYNRPSEKEERVPTPPPTTHRTKPPPPREAQQFQYNIRGKEPFHDDIDRWLGPPEGEFTGYLLFGSPESNQCFYYIHKHLRRVEPPPVHLFKPSEDTDDELDLISKPNPKASTKGDADVTRDGDDW